MTPEDEHVAKSCGRKRAYDTKREAKRVAKRIRLESGDAMKPYQCPYCTRYHLYTPAKVGKGRGAQS